MTDLRRTLEALHHAWGDDQRAAIDRFFRERPPPPLLPELTPLEAVLRARAALDAARPRTR